jgi:ABC-2 type transport system permease protein
MESFKASFLIEVEKMYRKKKAVIIVIMSLGIIIMVQLLSSVMRYGLGIIGNTGTVFPITVLMVFVNTILPLFTALVVIDTFTGEFSQETMKIMVTRPVSRFKIYTAKLAATATFVLANLLIVMILSSVIGFIFNAADFSAIGLFRIILSYLVTLIPIMTLAVVIAFLSNVFKSSAIVFFLAIILFFVMKALGVAFTSVSGLFLTSSMDWYRLWIADSLPWRMILSHLVLMAAYVLIFFTAGYYRFDKHDL